MKRHPGFVISRRNSLYLNIYIVFFLFILNKYNVHHSRTIDNNLELGHNRVYIWYVAATATYFDQNNIITIIL